MNGCKVLLGFSGGIDSSHSVEVLRDAGYEVTALYLDMYGDTVQLENARERAEELGVEFRSIDVADEFRRGIVDYFISEYIGGHTPAPCTVCNRDIKWKTLYETARREGFDHIATGHYFKVAGHNGRFYVAKAADPVKDQSYYLWLLDQQILSMALTPMGEKIKSEIRPRTVAKESMGVCFLQGRSCGVFLYAEAGEGITSGDIVDTNGRFIGRHNGTPFYTIGQKKGLELPPGMCVTAIDAAANTLTAGTDAGLYHRNLIVSGCNIVDMDEALTAYDITVKIRGIGRNPEQPCRIHRHEAGLHIMLDDPAWAPAVGQPVVLYRGDRVVGGGFLEEYF